MTSLNDGTALGQYCTDARDHVRDLFKSMGLQTTTVSGRLGGHFFVVESKVSIFVNFFVQGILVTKVTIW